MYSLEWLIFSVGFTIIFSIIIHFLFHRIGLPALIGYILLGILIKYANVKYSFFTKTSFDLFEFLASIGIISLLFRVGLESKLSQLLHELKTASLVWIGDVTVSWAFGYVFSYFLLDLGAITSIIIATALTATSVGVTVGAWQEYKLIDSREGRLLIDVAELDDISAIFLLALLFSILPVLKAGGSEDIIIHELLVKILVFILKFSAFTLFCVLFALKLEKHLTNFFKSLKNDTELILVVTGVAFMIAALAGIIGFSVAIGAFFAGLVFSRDPSSVKLDASFSSIYELFTPFFFIGIGLNIDPSTILTGTGLGIILLLAAVLGKFLGAGSLTYYFTGSSGGLLIGASMIPRAEICMIIMQKGLEMGSWAVPSSVFSGMVFVSAASIIISIILLKLLLSRNIKVSME